MCRPLQMRGELKKMRITIIALGSRGDVQPYIALGKGLHQAGHDVRFVTHEDFEGLVRGQGLAYWPARGSVQAILETDEMRGLVEKGNFIAITRATAKQAQLAARQWAVDGLAACQGTELIIAGVGGLFVGLALAEKLSPAFASSLCLSIYTHPVLPEHSAAGQRVAAQGAARSPVPPLDPADDLAGDTGGRHDGARTSASPARRALHGPI